MDRKKVTKIVTRFKERESDAVALIRALKQAAVGEAPCHGCGRLLATWQAFRCYYCGFYYCAACAPEHFGGTRADYHARVCGSGGDPDQASQISKPNVASRGRHVALVGAVLYFILSLPYWAGSLWLLLRSESVSSYTLFETYTGGVLLLGVAAILVFVLIILAACAYSWACSLMAWIEP